MLRAAKRATIGSNHPLYKMGAVVVKGRRILSVASNQINRGCALIHDKKWNNTLHAEAAAIYKLLKHHRLSDLAGADLYVTRISKVGHLRMAKPCEFCEELARAVGIKQVFFSTNAGETECMRL
jgi:deoxycytidylate deaminase